MDIVYFFIFGPLIALVAFWGLVMAVTVFWLIMQAWIALFGKIGEWLGFPS